MTTTGNETADFLLRQIRFLKRVGSPQQKAEAQRWEEIVHTHATPDTTRDVVNFATAPAQEVEV